MMSVTSAELSKALSERVIAARGEVMQKTHTLSEAEYGRDALAKVNIILDVYWAVHHLDN